MRRALLPIALLAACTPATFDGAFVDEQEVTLSFPGVSRHATSGQDPRPLTLEVLDDLNAVLIEPVAMMGAVVEGAAGSVVDRREGGFGIYGPFEASAVDSELPFSFLLRVDDRFVRTQVEFWVAPPETSDESAFTRVAVVSRFEFEGALDVSLELDLAALAEFPELAPMLTSRYELGGTLRATVVDDGRRGVTVELDDASITRGAPVDRPFAGRGTLTWREREDGLSLELSARGPFDDHGFTGPAPNTMELRARVAESGAGRIEGTVNDGDVMFGPFTVVECWNPFLEPSYSFVDEAYQDLDPTLAEGNAEDCVFGSDDLP